MDAQYFLKCEAYEVMSRFRKFADETGDLNACAIVRSDEFEIHLSIMTDAFKAEMAAIEPPEADEYGEELTEGQSAVLMVIGNEPMSKDEIVRFTGYRPGGHLDDILLKLQEKDLICRRKRYFYSRVA